MKKAFALAPAALLGLLGASPPMPAASSSPDGAAYPACSATVTDRCMQTYERTRRSRHARAQMPERAPEAAPVQVSGGDYPPCTAERQDRCTQGVRRPAAPTRYAMAERERIRIGERG